MATLLQERDAARAARRAELFGATRQALRVAVEELIPGKEIILFGSITRCGVFNARSDIDIALEQEPTPLSTAQLVEALEERLRRSVDLVLLPQCRFAEKIRREGERWMP
jgi:predicted nucleotidyltransferase